MNQNAWLSKDPKHGICLLDVQTGVITDNRGILVIPERSTIGSFCAQLTTITPEMIKEEGVSFKETLDIIKKEYHGPSRVWASFGAYDEKMFRKQCAALGEKYPFGASHINVKSLFAVKNKLLREQGMARALKILGIPLEGTHHRGKDDALNIAKILKSLLD